MHQYPEWMELQDAVEYHPDGYLVWAIDRRRARKGARVGATGWKGYRCFIFDGKPYREHRVVFWLHHGYWPETVDHINEDKLDNRIENLRNATRELNRANTSRPQKNNKSTGVKGVYPRQVKPSDPHPYYAKFRRRRLGKFATIEEASAVYEAERRKVI